jgi:hypothetical protein
MYCQVKKRGKKEGGKGGVKGGRNEGRKGERKETMLYHFYRHCLVLFA